MTNVMDIRLTKNIFLKSFAVTFKIKKNQRLRKLGLYDNKNNINS